MPAKLPVFFVLLAFVLPSPHPDEGQWLPQQILTMDWDQLRARGMEMTKDQFWHPERGGVLSAAVQINGCTASFCSPEGLVVTNHHCGFGAVNQLSTPEHNYLRDGFVANSLEDELPAPGMVVSVVRRIENVTDQVHAAQAEARTPIERWARTQAVIRELVEEAEKEPHTTCSVASFLEGKEYHLYYRTRLTDVRLVYAPPRSVGEYGGEIDNWEWPRHTGDFSFFRAYAAPDGSPRDHDPENVPFRPAHHLAVSAEGVDEDDLVLVLGYPGRTERYLTSVAVADREGFYYPKRLAILTDIVLILEAYADRGEAENLEVASMIKSLANVQKNAAGMVWGLERNAVVERKQREEEAFTAWLGADPERTEQWGTVLDQLVELDLRERQTQQKDLVLGLSLSSAISPFLRGLVDLVTAAHRDEHARVVAAGRDPEALFGRFSDGAIMARFESVQRPTLAILFAELRALEGDDAVAGREALAPGEDVGAADLVSRILDESTMVTEEGRAALYRGGSEAVETSEDPLVVLALGLARERSEMIQRNRSMAGERLDVGRKWIEAQQAWRGQSFYPDANSTLRVSIASVRGYAPRDGVVYVPHTTVAGLLHKHTGEEPFDAPEELVAAAADRHESRFVDADVGDVPVCFLADADTTGGNSGSPVINGRGELVGLNFDRVFENVAGDFGWNPERSRNVAVDIRFVLWCLEKVMPAPHLLTEMGVGE